jgi:hypothetical protein
LWLQQRITRVSEELPTAATRFDNLFLGPTVFISMNPVAGAATLNNVLSSTIQRVNSRCNALSSIRLYKAIEEWRV